MSDAPDQAPDTAPSVTPAFSKEQRFAVLDRLRHEQNLAGALLGGLGAAVVGAILWALITLALKVQIGFMAIGVGLLVGMAVSRMGKGLDNTCGIIGGTLALIGCVLGNVLTIYGAISRELDISIVDVLLTMPTSGVADALGKSFSPIDLLFYGIAVHQGYKRSFRAVTEEEIALRVETSAP